MIQWQRASLEDKEGIYLRKFLHWSRKYKLYASYFKITYPTRRRANVSFFCTHFWLSLYIYISRESSLVINRDTISNDAISTLRVVRASIGLAKEAGLSVEKFYRLATGRTEAFPTRACFSVGVVQAWLDNDTSIVGPRIQETWYLQESSGFQLFLPPLSLSPLPLPTFSPWV